MDPDFSRAIDPDGAVERLRTIEQHIIRYRGGLVWPWIFWPMFAITFTFIVTCSESKVVLASTLVSLGVVFVFGLWSTYCSWKYIGQIEEYMKESRERANRNVSDLVSALHIEVSGTEVRIPSASGNVVLINNPAAARFIADAKKIAGD